MKKITIFEDNVLDASGSWEILIFAMDDNMSTVMGDDNDDDDKDDNDDWEDNGWKWRWQ